MKHAGYPGFPSEDDPDDEKGDPALGYIDGNEVEMPQTDDDYDGWTENTPADLDNENLDNEEELNFAKL